MGLKYDPGPQLDRQLKPQDLAQLKSLEEATHFMQFQKRAVQLTREALPKNKSLIGFVGGPWTLFSYAASGGHDGNLITAKTQLDFFCNFSEVMLPLLTNNIQLQLDGGAEVVMIFDTAAGELSPQVFNSHVAPGLNTLAKKFAGRLGYYSKSTQLPHLAPAIFAEKSWAGFGVDHRWHLADTLRSRSHGFLQGNFDQALLFSETADFRKRLQEWLQPLQSLSVEERRGWVCGLGHGVLPKTPEAHVREFVQTIRETFSR